MAYTVTQTKTNQSCIAYWFDSYKGLEDSRVLSELPLGAICYVGRSGIYVVKQDAQQHKYLKTAAGFVKIVSEEQYLPDYDEARTGEVDQEQIYYVSETNKLYAYDNGAYEWVPINPIPYLGNGDVAGVSGGQDINATPGSASPTKVVTEKQVSKFVSDQIALLSAGIGSVHHEPVADITALKALDSTEQTDKEIILVEAENSIWRWDAEATTAPTASGASTTTVVLPTDLEEDYAEDPTTPGRWIKLLNGASLILTSATPAQIGFEDPNNDNVYTTKAATAGVSTEVARADHVHELIGVVRTDQICWNNVVVTGDNS